MSIQPDVHLAQNAQHTSDALAAGGHRNLVRELKVEQRLERREAREISQAAAAKLRTPRFA